MTMYGANADELDRVAKAMIDAADDLENDTGFLSRLIQSVPWVGGVAKAFISVWESNHSRRLNQSVQFLRLTADGLTRNAAQQREASNDTGAAGGGSPGPHPNPGPGTMPPEVAALVSSLKDVFNKGGRLRNIALAATMLKALRTMGTDKVAMAVAALWSSGNGDVLRATFRGAMWSPFVPAVAIATAMKAGWALASPRPRPRPLPLSGLGRIFRPFAADAVRRWQRSIPVWVPWKNPFIFDDCYPVSWDRMQVRFAR